MDDRFVQPDGDKIRRIRQGNFWSQEQLADRAGLRKRTIERAEAGERLQRSTFRAIAQALGLSPEELVSSGSSFEPQHDKGQSLSPKPSSVPPISARATGRDEALREGGQADSGGAEIGLLQASGRCSGCGIENPPGMKFCTACGSPLGSRCPSCGAENGPGAKFCGACGVPLTEPSLSLQRQALTPRPQTPLSYTPVHLAEKILSSKGALEGERKQVTVLFANLQGAAELLGDRDPEEAQRVLDPFLDRMMEAIHRYEGTINHILGDGMMALFGAPLAHEDHAARACYAALAMQKAILQRAEELRPATGIEIQLRAGLNSGEVVVRTIGNDLHMEYSVIGQTTYLAAQLEQLVPPGAIWLAGETFRLVEGFVRVKPLDSVPIAGLTGPVDVYELIGAELTRTRLQAATARVLTPFVGRQHELEVLRQALELASTGHGQVVAVIGEPGVGKSRLFLEFIQAHHTKGWLILEAGAVSSYGKATPYLPIIDLLKSYFQLEGPDDGREMHEKVADKVLALDEALRPTLPAFFTLLDIPIEDLQGQAREPRQHRQHILDAVKRLLLRESQIQPLLVIVENLHWIDTETQVFLDSLIESLPTAWILLLVNYRPEYQHSWGNKTYYTQLRLDPLLPAFAEELLEVLLGHDTSLQPLKQRLIERTEGNPFFLEESVWTLAETKTLAGERGAYRMVQALPSIRVPTTVQAMLAARLDRLPVEDKRLLQAAAVIGKDIPSALLQALYDGPEEALRRSLTRLQATEFLYEMHLFPEHVYTFKHALTQEVVYQSLLQSTRRQYHQQVAQVLAERFPDTIATQPERLAHHYAEAGLWQEASQYWRKAGQRAFERSAYREAVVCFEQALLGLQHLPESRDRTEQDIDVRFDLRNSLIMIGALEQILDHLRVAESLSQAIGDQRRLGWVSDYMGSHFRNIGKYYEAVEAGERSLAVAQDVGDFALRVAANFHLGAAYHALGNYRRGIDFLTRNLASIESDLNCERFGLSGAPSILSRGWLVLCLAELGEFVEGIRIGNEALRIAEMADQGLDLIYAYRGVVLLYLRKGELDKTIALAERGLGLCQVGDLPGMSPWFISSLTYAYALSGHIADALPLLDQATSTEMLHRGPLLGWRALSFAWLSEASLAADRMDDAIRLVERALEFSRGHKEQGHEAWALRILGEIYSYQGPQKVEQAQAAYRQAMAAADKLGMRPLLAHCHLGLGTLYARIGRLEQAQSELSMAIDMYRAMEMTFWLNRAQVIQTQAE